MLSFGVNTMDTPSPYDTLVTNPFKTQETPVVQVVQKAPLSAILPVTSELPPPENMTNMPRWGTAYLGKKTQVQFTIAGYDDPLVCSINQEKLVLGRRSTQSNPLPVLPLDDYDAHLFGVSRHHAALVMRDGTLYIVDLGSTNGTYLNGHRLEPRQGRILRNGDQLRLGNLVMDVSFG